MQDMHTQSEESETILSNNSALAAADEEMEVSYNNICNDFYYA